eukprot:g3939.t1
MGGGVSTNNQEEESTLNLQNAHCKTRQEIEAQVAKFLKDVTNDFIDRHHTSKDVGASHKNKKNENNNLGVGKSKQNNKKPPISVDIYNDFSFPTVSNKSIDIQSKTKSRQSFVLRENISCNFSNSPQKNKSILSQWNNNDEKNFYNPISSPIPRCNDINNSQHFYSDPKCHKYYVAKVIKSMRNETKNRQQENNDNSSVTNVEKYFNRHWKIIDSNNIGVGSSATVFPACSTIDPRLKVAVKLLDKSKLSLSMSKKQKLLVMSRNEAALLQKLNHPNIAKFIAYYETETNIYIVSEYCAGGELFEYIIDRPEGLNENEGKIITRQLASALSHMHQRGVMHRDVKPENILLERENDLTSVKFIDFGLSCAAKHGQSFLGTAGYVAPEMASNSPSGGVYDSSVDMWALGVTLYAALTGYMPFEESDEGDSLARGVARIQEQPVQFPLDVFRGISKDCINCLSRLLTVDPKMRITADELLLHPWISNGKSISNKHSRNAHAADTSVKSKRKKEIMQILRLG